MAQPFGIGDVVGGRYRITHHVVTSADQDIIFQGIDQVLNREVSILLASTQNAKQVATSARELATGERSSGVQVLDLGMTQNRTYLISTHTDPNDLMDLVVPDAAPYVEPFFTDSLGSEIFGQSRVMEPETFDDDPEYYAGLQEVAPGPAEDDDAGAGYRRRRPAFLDKVSESLSRRLGTDRDADRIQKAVPQAAGAPETPASPESPESSGSAEQDTAAPDDEARRLSLSQNMELVEVSEEADADEEFGASSDAAPRQESDAPSSAAVSSAAPALQETSAVDVPAEVAATEADDEMFDGEEVIDDPPREPVSAYDAPAAPSALQVQGGAPRRLGETSFTGLISAVPPGSATAFPHQETEAAEPALAGAGGVPGRGEPEPRESAGSGRWIGVGVLAAIVLIAAVVGFFTLRGGDVPDTVAEQDATEEADEDDGTGTAEEADEDEATEEATDEDAEDDAEDDAEADEEPELPEPAIAGVTRLVTDSPELNEQADDALPNTFDGDTSTAWTTLSFGSPQFGGFASQMALVVELEETSEVNAVTLTQQGQADGGSFEVLVNDSASLDGADEVGSGTWNWTETTVELDEAVEGQYLLINTTELPQRLDGGNPDLPYGLEVAQIQVD